MLVMWYYKCVAFISITSFVVPTGALLASNFTHCRLVSKVTSNYVTPACLYGTETLALTELQQQRLQVCENNWVRKIARVVTRADRRRLLRSRLQWAGRVERMADDRLPKRASELREQGRRRRGSQG